MLKDEVYILCIIHSLCSFDKYSLRHRECDVRGCLHELFASKIRTDQFRKRLTYFKVGLPQTACSFCKSMELLPNILIEVFIGPRRNLTLRKKMNSRNGNKSDFRRSFLLSRLGVHIPRFVVLIVLFLLLERLLENTLSGIKVPSSGHLIVIITSYIVLKTDRY